MNKRALIKEPGIDPVVINSPDDVERMLAPLKHYAEEHFVSLHLDGRNQVVGYQIVSHGTLTAFLVHPREVFKAALVSNSHSLIVAHNHPAGSLKPSAEDIETTRTLIKAGKILGVSLLDHIVVSSKGTTSIRETQPELWG